MIISVDFDGLVSDDGTPTLLLELLNMGVTFPFGAKADLGKGATTLGMGAVTFSICGNITSFSIDIGIVSLKSFSLLVGMVTGDDVGVLTF